jgi:hypothetical protein
MGLLLISENISCRALIIDARVTTGGHSHDRPDSRFSLRHTVTSPERLRFRRGVAVTSAINVTDRFARNGRKINTVTV